MKEDFFNESELTNFFNKIDTHHNHIIDENELDEILKKFGIPENYYKEIFKKMDKDKDNIITYEEFKSYIIEEEKNLLIMYNSIDQNKDGKLTYDDFSLFLEKFYPGKKFEENFIMELITSLDIHHTGIITFEEFRNILVFLPVKNFDFLLNWNKESTILYKTLTEDFPINFSEENMDTKNIYFLRSFLAGGLAAALSKTITSPFDRLKTLYQTKFYDFSKPPNMFRGLLEIYKRDGFKGLFRGNFVNVMKSSPDTSIRFTIFDFLKQKYRKKYNEKNLPHFVIFVSGAISGLISSYFIYPLSVIKTRLAAAPNGEYNGFTDAYLKISKTEGKILPFFSGISASSLLIVLASGMSLTYYDILRGFYSSFNKGKEVPLSYLMFIGALSSGFTNIFCYPLQLITTNMMMQGMIGQKMNMFSLGRNIYNKKGVFGFYQGFVPLMNKLMIGNAISFSAYDKFKSLLCK